MLLNAPVSIDVDGEPRALDEVSWSEERAEVEYLADYLEAKYQTESGALKKPMARIKRRFSSPSPVVLLRLQDIGSVTRCFS